MTENVFFKSLTVTHEQRKAIKNQEPCLLWFTGLSASGKTTLANALELKLNKNGYHTYMLDGDNTRTGLNRDLGFTKTDRSENIRRIGEVGKLFVDAGIITLTAFISPYRKDREMVRDLFKPGEFIEIYLSTPLEVCEVRDPKGLYKKARKGEIKQFTGVDDIYEVPVEAELKIDTAKHTIEECLELIINYLIKISKIVQCK